MNGRVAYPRKLVLGGKLDGKYVVEEYSIRRPFLEEMLAKHGYDNKTTCLRKWKESGVLDCDQDRFTRTRKVIKSGSKEDVYVLKVFSDSFDYGGVEYSENKKALVKKRNNSSVRASVMDLLKDDDEDEEDEGDKHPDSSKNGSDEGQETEVSDSVRKEEVVNHENTSQDENDGKQWEEYCDLA